jgi:hypothetical protein
MFSSAIAQLVERLAVNLRSFPEESGLSLSGISVKPFAGNTEGTRKDDDIVHALKKFRDQCNEDVPGSIPGRGAKEAIARSIGPPLSSSYPSEQGGCFISCGQSLAESLVFSIKRRMILLRGILRGMARCAQFVVLTWYSEMEAEVSFMAVQDFLAVEAHEIPLRIRKGIYWSLCQK